MSEQLELSIDVERRTTRGRSCPRCSGKIIPSIRAVYQGAGDPNSVFNAWQCERCSYEEVIAKPAAKPVREPAAKAAATETRQASSPASGSLVAPAVRLPQAEPLLDAKGRALPPDVRAMIAQMKKAQPATPAAK